MTVEMFIYSNHTFDLFSVLDQSVRLTLKSSWIRTQILYLFVPARGFIPIFEICDRCKYFIYYVHNMRERMYQSCIAGKPWNRLIWRLFEEQFKQTQNIFFKLTCYKYLLI